MNSKFERQLWMVLITLMLMLVMAIFFLLIFAWDDVAWATGTVWEKVSPFLPFFTGAIGFWMGFRAASGQVGKVLNTVSMAVPGFVASAKMQTEMAKMERYRTVDQQPLPPSSRRDIQPYQAPPVNPYQDVIDGYQGALRGKQFSYMEESDYTSGNEGF